MDQIATALFALGQIVRHRDAAFRGVVLDVDPVFAAGDGARLDAVDRDQPFYHVLTLGADGGFLAYAAQEILEHDPGPPLPLAEERRLFNVDLRGRHAPKARAIH